MLETSVKKQNADNLNWKDQRMASTKKKMSGNNLATLLSVKQKLTTKNKNNDSDDATKSTAVVMTGAHSDERLKYRQMGAVETVPIPNQTKTPAANQSDPLKIGRNEKQLEIGLLEKKMAEIQKKQDQKTNEAVDAWKGFEMMNYGFGYNGPPPIQQVTTFFFSRISFLRFLSSTYFLDFDSANY